MAAGLVLTVASLPVPLSAAQAEGCPNEGVRLAQVYASTLPDCRAYEQVSPVRKNLAEAKGSPEGTISSPSGDRMTFSSTFSLPGASSGNRPTWYLSARVGDEWSTGDVGPLAGPVLSASEVVKGGVTEDLGEFVGVVANLFAAVDSSFYLRDSTGKLRPFVQGPPGGGHPWVVGASRDDSRILFEDEALLGPKGELLGVSPYRHFNLYEWDEGTVSLVAEAANAGDGSGEEGYYVQHAISEDGSRVFYTPQGVFFFKPDVGQIYMREDMGEPVKISAGAAQWQAATPGGEYVFYTEGKAEDEELLRFNVNRFDGELASGVPEAEALANAREALTGGVMGMVDVSDDGSYVYFVNSGAGLYLWHEGASAPLFIAQPENAFDWTSHTISGVPETDSEGMKSARVTPAGTTLMFTSAVRLTSYDNHGLYEIYLYDTPTAADPAGVLRCVSCSPSVARALKSAYLVHNYLGGGTFTITESILTRNLSDSGNQVFFETEEGLLPRDHNGLMDVYEWEREGAGSCVAGSGDENGGCLYLISTGSGTSETYFGDASASGGDVFFFTNQSLVGQDRDLNTDVYDARVGGGIPAQNSVLAVPCVGEECHGVPAPAPAFGVPSGSATFVGSGNPAPAPAPTVAKTKPAKCRKGLVRVRGRCRRVRAAKGKRAQARTTGNGRGGR